MKTVTAVIGVAFIAGTGAYLFQQKRHLRAEARYQASLRAQPEIPPANDQAEAAMETMTRERETLQKQARDLPRLRNEVAQLRSEKTDREHESKRQPPPAASTPAPLAPGKYIQKGQLAFAGYGTPEGSAQSEIWAVIAGNYEVATKLLGPMERSQFDEQVANYASAFKGIQILARKVVSDDRVELKVKFDLRGDRSVSIWQMVRVGNEWKHEDTSVHEPDWEKTGTLQTFTPQAEP